MENRRSVLLVASLVAVLATTAEDLIELAPPP